MVDFLFLFIRKKIFYLYYLCNKQKGMIEMQKSFYVKVNNEIENYFNDEYLDKDYLEIYVDEFQPFSVDDIEWNKIVFEHNIIDAYIEKEALILQFKHSYVESLREETYDDWNDMLIQQKNEYYSNLF